MLIAGLVMLVSIWLGVILTKGQSNTQKWIMWGLLLILGIGPSISWLLGVVSSVVFEDGFTGMATLIVTYAVLFIVGLLAIVVGLFKKD